LLLIFGDFSFQGKQVLSCLRNRYLLHSLFHWSHWRWIDENWLVSVCYVRDLTENLLFIVTFTLSK